MFPCAIKVWSISHLQIKGNKYPGSQVNFCTKALTAISPWDSRVSRTFRVCSVMSNSLRPHRLQHARLPCPSIISQNWLKLMSIESVMPPNHLILCHPLLLPSIFPSIRSFPMSWLFASGGQRIGASASASVLPVSTQGWSPLNIYPWMAHTPGFIFPIFNRTSFFLLSDDKWWCVVFFVMRLFPSSPISDFAQEKLLNMSHSLGHELPRIWTHGSPFSLLQRKTLNHHCILDWECQASSWTP